MLRVVGLYLYLSKSHNQMDNIAKNVTNTEMHSTVSGNSSPVKRR
jgi:hypothetical protein